LYRLHNSGTIAHSRTPVALPDFAPSVSARRRLGHVRQMPKFIWNLTVGKNNHARTQTRCGRKNKGEETIYQPIPHGQARIFRQRGGQRKTGRIVFGIEREGNRPRFRWTFRFRAGSFMIVLFGSGPTEPVRFSPLFLKIAGIEMESPALFPIFGGLPVHPIACSGRFPKNQLLARKQS